ncbi:MAG TPA: hypothetical protein VF753_05445 [Terriglobales bacterium]
MTTRTTKTALALALAAMMLSSLSSFAKATVNFLGAGSSAMFNTFAYAGYKSSTCGSNIWSFKNGAQGVDNRGAGVPAQLGTVWVEWDNSTAPKVVCAYLSVDSVVGNTLFFAKPNSTFQIVEAANTPGQSKIPGITDTAGGIPAAVIAALNNQAFNAGMTDIRPEDALFATNRALGTLDTVKYNGLGYGPGPVGTPISDSFGLNTSATPVLFALSGKDPISGQFAKTWTTTSVGAEPVVIFVNTTQTGSDGDFSNANAFQNVNRFDLTMAVNGTYPYTRDISSATGLPAIPMNIALREPTSGTYNTFEFCIPRSLEINSTQELGVNPGVAGGNPLNIANPYSGGWRKRVIGTGEMTSEVSSAANGNVLGYAFWSTGNFANIQGNVRYLTLDGVDPIFPSYEGGTFPPNCSTNCPGEVSFTNIINGSYPAWTVLRVATVSPIPAGVQALITNAQNFAVSTIPDFVPFSVNGSQYLTVFRSHFSRPGLKPGTQISNGHISGVQEHGGDEGGAVLTLQADLDNITDTGLELLNLKQ